MSKEILIKLEILKKEKKSLDKIADVSFKNKKEGEKYIKKHYQELQRLNEIEEQIELLEWELKSPEEQEKAKKRDRFLTLKAKGEPFDLSEFEDLNEY